MSGGQKPLAGCPWCGSTPELFSSVYGHRQEPMRSVGYRCAKCGVSRSVHIGDKLEQEARKLWSERRTWEHACMLAAEDQAREKWNTRV